VKYAASTSQVEAAEAVEAADNPARRDAVRVTLIRTHPQADIKRVSDTIAALMISAVSASANEMFVKIEIGGAT